MYNVITKLIHYEFSSSPFNIEIILPNGKKFYNHKHKPDLTIKIKSWLTFLRASLFGSYGIATDYIKERIDIDGDLRILGYLTYHKCKEEHLSEATLYKIHDHPILVRIMNWWHMLKYCASNFETVRYNAEFHYGHDPEFYFNYLGPTGAYSTGFWYTETKNVEEAQNNKWEMILRKLKLEPGMKIASVGSGFGYGEMLAAEKYRVKVDCFNVCRPQNKWLREEIKKRGLEDKIRVFDEEYRNVSKKHKNYYDKLLIIECIEHAQTPFRMETFRAFFDCLKPDGVAIMQFLSYDIESDVSLYIRKYLYPGVTMPPLGKMLDELAYSGFEIQDILCNRRHYYYTLNSWYENLQNNWDTIRAINSEKYNERFKRNWSLYLASGSYYLVTPDAVARLYQVTFTKGNTHTYPMNRDFIYNENSDDSAWVKPHQFFLDGVIDK